MKVNPENMMIMKMNPLQQIQPLLYIRPIIMIIIITIITISRINTIYKNKHPTTQSILLCVI